MYTAQGDFVVHETFTNSNVYFKGLDKCEQDQDCLNKQWSCRVLPISFNGSTKVCMPDEQQYKIFNGTWQM